VLSRIREESPTEYELEESFRSSPPVLRAVSAVRKALGGAELTSAVPEEWEGRGSVRLLRSRHVDQEADAVVDMVKDWCERFPDQSIAVMARTGPRRRPVDQTTASAGLAAEIWDFPVHRPLIAEMLTRHLDVAILTGDDQAIMQELYNRCLMDLDQNDLDALDELQDACEAIEKLRRDGYELVEIVSGIRISSDPDAPVGPGLHLMNGHVSKGQQFDRVIVIGLEEAILPHFAAMLAEQQGDEMQIAEELAVLHVMVSRAREDLVVSVADIVPKWNGADLERTPSRFLQLIEPICDTVVDLR
jgi:DNA helicase-2/ATP-dependent DNA helicase PcrA